MLRRPSAVVCCSRRTASAGECNATHLIDLALKLVAEIIIPLMLMILDTVLVCQIGL
jgi:hypothetical protein